MSDSYSLTKNYQMENPLQYKMRDPSNFFSPIHNTHMTQLPPGNLAQNYPPKLTPQNNIKYQIKKKTLILDLDETLVHSSMRPFQKCADITLPLNYNGRSIFIYVLKRPFLEQFLQEMSLIYDIIIFTASLADYAEPLLDIIDKNKIIKYRLNRSHCRHYQNIYIKDLKVINRNLKDMIIVDNNPESYLMNKENAIPILTWEDDANDTELVKLIPVLKYLSTVDDVRNVINKIVDRNNEKVDFNAFNKIITADSNLNNINNNVVANNLNVISNKNIINTSPNITNKVSNKIISNKDVMNQNNNINNNNVNYNLNKKIYIKKEIIGNAKLNKRISLPNNTNNKFILNNKNPKPLFNNYLNNNQHNSDPKDSKRKIGTKTLKLNLDNNKFQNHYANNSYLNIKNQSPDDNFNYIKERMNTSPVNQINVSNSTINIFNNKPEIKILVNGPSQKPDINKIKKIKDENLSPIRKVKNKNIIPNKGNDNKANLITPIKIDYNNSILSNPNLEKTYDNKITKTISVRKLFEQPNHSFDKINYNQNDPQKINNAKAKNMKIINNNGFAYNPNMMKYMNNSNNSVKNNNIVILNNNNNVVNNNINNKIIKIDRWDNTNNNNNFKKNFLRSEKSYNYLNRATKIKKIEVVHSKKNIKSPDKSKKIKMKVKEKEIINNIDFNNYRAKQTKKIIMERESFNREKFLKENFGIVDSY